MTSSSSPEIDSPVCAVTVVPNRSFASARTRYEPPFVALNVTRSSPLLAAVAGQTQAELESAVAKLPLKYREVLLLVVVEGFDLSP